MPSRKPKPCHSKKAAKCNFPQIRNLDPDQRGRDIPEEIMAEGQGGKDSSPPGGHRSSRPTQQQYRDRQPYVRRPQQYQDHRTYEPRPGPEGRHPHYPEQYPSSRGAERRIRNLDPDQCGRDIPEEIMAEGRRSRYSSPPGGHRSSTPTQQQYRDRQPYVRRPQQYQDHRTYEPRPGPEGRHPHYPEQYPSSRGAERRIRNRDPDQRGRDIPEEIMAEGRGSRYSSPPGGHRSSRPTQQQYHDRQPYVQRPQQYQDHRTYEPCPGPEGRHPHYPEQYPSSRGAERRIRNRDPDQRGRDIPEKIIAEGRESRDSSPPGGHHSSRPTQQHYRDRQPYVRRPQQYQDHRTYEPRPGPEGRHPHYPEQYPSSRGAERTIRNRDPDQRGRDIPEEIMAEGQGGKDSSPPGGQRSSSPTQQQHSKRPDKQTPKAVDPTTQPIVKNKKEASDTKPGPDDEPKLQPVGLKSSSPGLVPPDVQPKNSGNDCKPIMKRVSLPAEPESDITPVISPHSPQDLLKEVRSILNRQTPQKFLQLVKQVKDSPIDTEEQLKGVVDLLFEKAMDETSSLVAYAKMCYCLATLTVPTPDKPQKTVNLRKLLIIRCHEELEKLEKDKVDDVVKDITRRRSIGNIKFIGELFKVKMLNDFIVHDCLDKLLTNNDEVALECLCILLSVISKDLEYNETKMDHYFNSMEDIVTEGKTSPRIRYMLQDTIDLVSLNLVPRKAEQDPKPVQQIHNEATIEDQEEPRSVQQPLLSEDTKIQPDDAPTLQPVGLGSSSPGLVLPEAPVAALQPQASSPAQVPTPPQNQGSEARGTLESRTGSSKKRRRRRKPNNQLQTAGLRSASPGLVLPGAPGESGEAQATTPPREPELPLPASLSPLSIVEELLNFNDSKQLQCLHSDASSSEATLSEGSWSPWELQKQMLGIMLEDMACDSDIFDCVKEKLERSQKSSSPYLTELMTAVCQAAVKENTSCPVHAALLQKGLPVVLEDRHSEKEQQMKALKDLQELIVTLDGPPNLLRMFFTCMCDEDISSEDSCCKSGTGKDQEQLGKGVALQTVTAFFTWLREAEPNGN